MLRKYFLALVLLLAASVNAPAAWHSVLQVSVSSAPAYTGPLDVVGTATSCYAFFACSAAIATAATANTIGLVRASDSHRCIIKIAASGQIVGTVSGCSTSGDNGTAIATWCNATTCTAGDGTSSVHGIYDQTTNAFNADEVTAATDTLTVSCFSTFYCFTFAGSGSLLVSQLQSTLMGNNFTIIAWVRPTTLTSGTGFAIVGGQIGSGLEFRLTGQAGDATGKIELVKQQVSSVAVSTCAVSINAWHSVAMSYDSSGNYAFYADGVACGSGTNLVSLSQAGTNLVIGNATGEFFLGGMRGVVTYGSVLSGANIIAIEATGP